jgi:hypothetical protein
MLTLATQWLVSLPLVIFGILGLRIARMMPGRRASFQRTWAFTGAAFLVTGLNAAFHDLFATVGFLAGPGSALWNGVIAAHPILNHSRTFAEITYSAVLCFLLVRGGREGSTPGIRRPILVICAMMFLGGMVGANEQAFSSATHFTAVALWDILTLLSMFAALYAGMSTGRMDRSLWFSLGLFAFARAFSVIGFAALVQIDVPGQWHPRPSHIHFIKGLLHAGAAVIAWRHLASLRRHEEPRAFFEPARGRMMPSLHG